MDWDALDCAYLDAVEKGNSSKALDCLRTAASHSGYSIHAWHGTPDGRWLTQVPQLADTLWLKSRARER